MVIDNVHIFHILNYKEHGELFKTFNPDGGNKWGCCRHSLYVCTFTKNIHVIVS